jgi:hypothetical protein
MRSVSVLAACATALVLSHCGEERYEDEPLDATMEATDVRSGTDARVIWPDQGRVIEAGLAPAPDANGFCCPIDPPTCNCFRYGGWLSTEDPSRCPKVCDMAPPGTTSLDAHGCNVFSGPNSCLTHLPGFDAGDADAIDAVAESGDAGDASAE